MEKFVPFVSADSKMPEFTLKAVLLGVVMAMIMGAANAYLGLKAGMTIAATYTTAVIGMAVLKAMKGSILEENAARTIGSIGGNIATGAIFTLPAFFIASVWSPFFSLQNYVISATILIVAGVLGIMYSAILRKILIDNVELPFPESIAASEIHKSGQSSGKNSSFLLGGIGLGAFFTLLVEFKFIAAGWQKLMSFAKGGIIMRFPGMAPAYFGVGYIIGPKLSAVNFSGGVLAWGLLAPAVAYFLNYNNATPVSDWSAEITSAWKNYVRYIAIGGMLVGAFYTLYNMRKNLIDGIARSVSHLSRKKADNSEVRTEKDINIKVVLGVIGLVSLLMFVIFNYFAGNYVAAAVATIVMLLMGFVFAAVSGYLVGIIGVSSNPTSGLTISVVIITALLMVLLGLSGYSGIAAVLGIAAFTCTAVSVAGEMMQDLKAGHILGCTPWKMQMGDIFGIIASSLIMFFVISLLHLGDIKQATSNALTKHQENNITEITYKGTNAKLQGKVYSINEIKQLAPEQQNDILGTNAGFGGEKLPAPQASLMAVVAKGIIEAKMELILIVIGIFMGLALILMQVKSPMLISVGMYLPLETSFAIFTGGIIKWIMDNILSKRKVSEEAKRKSSDIGILLASGLIAGEALTGLLFAAFAFAEIKMFHLFENPSYLLSLLSIIIIGFILIYIPYKNAIKSDLNK